MAVSQSFAADIDMSWESIAVACEAMRPYLESLPPSFEAVCSRTGMSNSQTLEGWPGWSSDQMKNWYMGTRWLHKVACPSRFALSISGVSRGYGYFAISCKIWYDGVPVDPINVDAHNISLFQGSGCDRLDAEVFLKEMSACTDCLSVQGFYASE